MDKETLRNIILEMLKEDSIRCPVKLRHVSDVVLTEADRLNTGDSSHKVFTQDLFSLEESPRLGCGVMEMEQTTFPWRLQYDEIDYVIEGCLTIYCGDHMLSAQKGELLLIPKDTEIIFSSTEKTRFIYITYPADWKNA